MAQKKKKDKKKPTTEAIAPDVKKQDGKKESGLGKSRIRLYDNRLPLCGKLQKWCLG